MSNRTHAKALDALLTADPPHAELPPSPISGTKRKASFFLDADTHSTLVELRLKHGVSQQKVFEKALDMYLRSLGYPGIKDAGE